MIIGCNTINNVFDTANNVFNTTNNVFNTINNVKHTIFTVTGFAYLCLLVHFAVLPPQVYQVNGLCCFDKLLDNLKV